MSGSVKSIRHHQSLPGRDEDSAHAQYLRLAEETTQTMQGDLFLSGGKLKATRVEVAGALLCGNELRSLGSLDLIVGAKQACNFDLHILGSLGTGTSDGGDIYITGASSCQICDGGKLIVDVECVNIRGNMEIGLGRLTVCDELHLFTCDDPPLNLNQTALLGADTCGFIAFSGWECNLESGDAPIWCSGSEGDYDLVGSIRIRVNGEIMFLKYYQPSP
ncbi:MAG: hypothetical protein FVQ79_10865 [Planctomycetes bacterium]|nr:hypothetical protein [Planctomycetota bacterium]